MLSSDAIKKAARESGFPLVGIARSMPLERGPLEAWLSRGMSASMEWMKTQLAERLDPGQLLPGAASVIALGCCFLTGAHARSSPIALYAQGRDYHATLGDRLRTLRRRLSALDPTVRTYASVDTRPVMEKTWAERAGLGWIGKNSLLVTPEHGSHVLLAVMLVDREADRYDSPEPDRCGDCLACVSACPTGAITSPRVVDARRCLAAQTVESSGPFPDELKPWAGGRAFGCDECQRFCPWNKPEHACDDARFAPREIACAPLAELASLSREGFVHLTRGTAVARARYNGLRRNALVAMGACRDPRAPEVARRLLEDSSAEVRDAAQWALARAEESAR
jgi:epoxyqueuosine reductase